MIIKFVIIFSSKLEPWQLYLGKSTMFLSYNCSHPNVVDLWVTWSLAARLT